MKWWLVAPGVLIADTLTKFLWPTVQLNTGVSLGLGQASAGLVSVLSAVVILGLLWFLHPWRATRWWYQLGVGSLLGGAVANWVDRLIFGGVRDIWPLPFTPLYNNLADWAIAIGVVCLLYDEIRDRKTYDHTNSV